MRGIGLSGYSLGTDSDGAHCSIASVESFPELVEGARGAPDHRGGVADKRTGDSRNDLWQLGFRIQGLRMGCRVLGFRVSG